MHRSILFDWHYHYCLYNIGPIIRHHALLYGFHMLPNLLKLSVRHTWPLFINKHIPLKTNVEYLILLGICFVNKGHKSLTESFSTENSTDSGVYGSHLAKAETSATKLCSHALCSRMIVWFSSSDTTKLYGDRIGTA